MAVVESPDRTAPRAEVLIATSWDCNLRCDYCFLKRHIGCGQTMSVTDAQRLVDVIDQALPDVEQISLHLYGGEPLLHLRPAAALVRRASQKRAGRLTFAITTNGTVISDEAVALLDEGRFEVILSIDGPPEIHDQCRRTVGGRPTHRRVKQFLERLRRETRCWVRASAVVRAGWSLRQAVHYLGALDVDAVKAQAIRVPPGAPYELDHAQRRQYLTDLDAIGRSVIADLERGRKPLDDRFSNRVLQLLKGERRQAFCGAGRHVFGVTPDCAIRPCLLLDGPTLGTLDTTPELWRAAGRHWSETRRMPERCRACPASALCGGGCPAMLPVCGSGECEIVRRNARIARRIHRHFRQRPEALLPLAGIR